MSDLDYYPHALQCRPFTDALPDFCVRTAPIRAGMIGKLLGHNHVHTTARYAHLANDPLKSAANRIALRIAEVVG